MSALVGTVLVFVTETMNGPSALPGIFLDAPAVSPITAQMNGAASMAAAGSLGYPITATMNGQAQMQGSTLAVTISAAEMDGVASMAAVGIAKIAGTARMDGVASMVAAWPLGAAVGQMDGAASMVAYVPVISKLSLFEDIRLADSRMLQFMLSLRATIALSANLITHTQYRYIITSTIKVRPTLVPAWHAVLNLVQGIGISQVTSQAFIWGRMLTDIVKVSGTVSVNGIYKKILAQLFKLSDLDGFSHTIPIVLSQNINLLSSSVMAVGLKLLQNLLMASSSSPIFNYHLTLASRTIVADIIGHYHFASMVLTQLFTMHPVVNRQYVANSSMAQLLTVHPALNNKLVLQITGNLQLSPSQLVHAIYKGDPLLDGVVITALYVSPSGTTTTWAVNTRTNAVTEYMNYDFRSFTRMGDRYIAAGGGGLYELDGDTDDGTAIISELMSGYLQLNDKKLFGIKGAYVAIRGGGRFYLKLLSGDGREYVYELKAQPNLMTTKVRIGKGISTTYIAFDLVTEGQDFDLDSLEFIPMTRGRRV